MKLPNLTDAHAAVNEARRRGVPTPRMARAVVMLMTWYQVRHEAGLRSMARIWVSRLTSELRQTYSAKRA